MANGIRTDNPRGFNKGRSSKFRVGYRVQQTPEDGRRTYQPKHCGNNNKDEDNSLKAHNDKSLIHGIIWLIKVVVGRGLLSSLITVFFKVYNKSIILVSKQGNFADKENPIGRV